MIDLRSDTVTKPTAAMRAAMAAAEVGDDVLEGDPTVRRLEAVAAERTGHEAALFLPSGTQANLAALLTHCGRGDEYLVAANGHTFRYEQGGAAALGGIVPQPLPPEADGTLDLDLVATSIKPDDPHFAQARLLSLENTTNGKAIAPAYFGAARAFVDRVGLALHLDGARIFNAAVAHGVEVTEYTAKVDSVSFCLSKGLGAPVGSMLCGSADFMVGARRARKVLGGAMRQAGILAAAGLVALETHVERLAEDHANADRLAAGLSNLDYLDVAPAATNMVFVRLIDRDVAGLVRHVADHGVLVLAGNPMRLVTHLDVDAAAIDAAIDAFASY